ncbi:MAG: AAA family ATPase, partial [Crinalium sp.]
QFRSSTSPFTDDQWRILIRDYNLCTPAEIANAVKKAAQEVFVRNQREGDPDTELRVTLNDLRYQRSLFTPAMVRDEDQIYAIRNKAPYARPASGNDKSRFAASGAELFS